MSVAVPGVHTHELCVDAQDNLYGEHLWGEGDGWRHRVWRRQPDGTLADIIPAREGFLRNYSFVHDRAGTMYWAEVGDKTVIKKRLADGKITTHVTGDFHAVQWMTVRADGTLFLMDGGNLRSVAPDGKVATVVTNLSGRNPPPAGVSDRNYHMGLWTDKGGSVYVAVARERLVLRVESGGKTTVAAQSVEPWSPSGGMFDRDGDLWLLEYDSANAVRARRIGRDGRQRAFDAVAPNR
jgi:sugar lactone lactonase YvrE